MNQKLLMDLLSQPTAPFRELHVLSFVKKVLLKNNVPHFFDPIGNLILGVRTKEEYLKRMQLRTQEPVRLFMAHTDHPGFHGVKWLSPTRLIVQWHGGTPVKKVNGARVWLGNHSGWLTQKATLKNAKLKTHKRSMDQAVVELDKATAQKISKLKAQDLFGAFAFRSPCWKSGKMIYTKAADDLVGCFAIIEMALKWGKNPPSSFIGILTRAEEVGFIGAIGHFELGWHLKAKRPVVLISLETSKTLPGADIGKGPVVRLGDRGSVFQPGYVRLMRDLGQKVLPGKFQLKLMDGGTCEATAGLVYGIASVGISVPLGNYHNQSFLGGPDSRGKDGPAPEFVHLDDIAGMQTLCRALVESKELSWENPWKTQKTELKKTYQKLKPLFKY